MVRNNNFRLFSMLIFGVLFIWGSYVLYMNKPTSISVIDTHKVVILPEQEMRKPNVFEKENAKNILVKKVVHTPKKMVEKTIQSFKPHHLYVKSDAQIKREFEKRRTERKKFKLREEQKQRDKKLNKEGKRNGNV